MGALIESVEGLGNQSLLSLLSSFRGLRLSPLGCRFSRFEGSGIKVWKEFEDQGLVSRVRL